MKKSDYDKQINKLLSEGLLSPKAIFHELLLSYTKQMTITKTPSLIWLKMFPNKELSERLLKLTASDAGPDVQKCMDNISDLIADSIKVGDDFRVMVEAFCERFPMHNSIFERLKNTINLNSNVFLKSVNKNSDDSLLIESEDFKQIDVIISKETTRQIQHALETIYDIKSKVFLAKCLKANLPDSLRLQVRNSVFIELGKIMRQENGFNKNKDKEIIIKSGLIYDLWIYLRYENKFITDLYNKLTYDFIYSRSLLDKTNMDAKFIQASLRRNMVSSSVSMGISSDHPVRAGRVQAPKLFDAKPISDTVLTELLSPSNTDECKRLSQLVNLTSNFIRLDQKHKIHKFLINLHDSCLSKIGPGVNMFPKDYCIDKNGLAYLGKRDELADREDNPENTKIGVEYFYATSLINLISKYENAIKSHILSLSEIKNLIKLEVGDNKLTKLQKCYAIMKSHPENVAKILAWSGVRDITIKLSKDDRYKLLRDKVNGNISIEDIDLVIQVNNVNQQERALTESAPLVFRDEVSRTVLGFL